MWMCGVHGRSVVWTKGVFLVRKCPRKLLTAGNDSVIVLREGLDLHESKQNGEYFLAIQH
jgi:hypothetical protein